LWPVNVSATANLLEAAFESRFLDHFVFVSGGAKLDGAMDRQLASAPDGYTQTKLISQALIQDVAARSRKLLNLRLSFVKPGFIIGNAIDGIANPRDYLWRFVASAINLGVYDSSTREAWITVSTDQRVAEVIVNQLLPSTADSKCEVLLECGIWEKELWQILVQNVGYRLQPVDHWTWVRRLQKSLDRRRESHLLWPLHGVLEKQSFGIGRDCAGAGRQTDLEILRPAILRNIKGLADMNFIPKPIVSPSRKRKAKDCA
jgi:thioester reductase-like protein